MRTRYEHRIRALAVTDNAICGHRRPFAGADIPVSTCDTRAEAVFDRGDSVGGTGEHEVVIVVDVVVVVGAAPAE